MNTISLLRRALLLLLVCAALNACGLDSSQRKKSEVLEISDVNTPDDVFTLIENRKKRFASEKPASARTASLEDLATRVPTKGERRVEPDKKVYINQHGEKKQ